MKSGYFLRGGGHLLLKEGGEVMRTAHKVSTEEVPLPPCQVWSTLKARSGLTDKLCSSVACTDSVGGKNVFSLAGALQILFLLLGGPHDRL